MNREKKYQELIQFNNKLAKSAIAELLIGFPLIGLFIYHSYVERIEAPLVSLAILILALGVVFTMVYMIKNLIVYNAPDQKEQLSYLNFWRSTLEKRKKLQEKIFWWYLLPLVPGILVLALFLPINSEVSVLNFPGQRFVLILFTALIFSFSYWLNKYHATRRIEYHLDTIDHLIMNLK